MSKFKLLIVIGLITSILSGCTNISKTDKMYGANPNDVANENSLHSVIETVSQSVNLNEMEEVYIRNISDGYYLIGYKEADDNFTNFHYWILNNHDNKMTEVKGVFNYVTDIKVHEGQLYLVSEGANIINGFREFPSQLLVDLETGELTKENLYYSIGNSYIERRMGNYLNETKLMDVETSEDSIIYHFGSTNKTIIAGGMFCPNISTSSTKEDTLIVDIENLVIENEQIKQLSNLSFIKEIEIREYEDSLKRRHLVQTIHLDSKLEYTCEFIDSNEGFMDLVIKFR